MISNTSNEYQKHGAYLAALQMQKERQPVFSAAPGTFWNVQQREKEKRKEPVSNGINRQRRVASISKSEPSSQKKKQIERKSTKQIKKKERGKTGSSLIFVVVVLLLLLFPWWQRRNRIWSGVHLTRRSRLNFRTLIRRWDWPSWSRRCTVFP